jgi:hypothetical protein
MPALPLLSTSNPRRRLAEARDASRRDVLARLALVLLFAFAACIDRAEAADPPIAPADFRQWTFDRLGDLGDEAAMALDYRNYPLAAYYDCGTTPKMLIFARFDGQVWERMPVAAVDSPCGGLFPGLSMQVGPDDRAQIAFFESRGPGASDDRLRYARRTIDDTWEITDIFSGGGRGVSLGLRHGIPAVAFKDSENLGLMYAERQVDGSWTVESTQSALAVSVALGLSLAFDDDGKALIAYSGAPPSFALMYATREPGGWQHGPIASGNVSGPVHQARAVGGGQVIAFQRFLSNGSTELTALHRLDDSEPFAQYRLGGAGPGGVAAVYGVGLDPDAIVAPILLRDPGQGTLRMRLARLDPADGGVSETEFDPEFQPFGTPGNEPRHGLALAFAANGAGAQLVYGLHRYGDMRWMRRDFEWSPARGVFQSDTDAQDGIAMAIDPNGRSELLFGAGCDLVHGVHFPNGFFGTRIDVPGSVGCGASQIAFAIGRDGRRHALIRNQSGGIFEATRDAFENAPWQFAPLGAGHDPHQFVASDGTRLQLWVNGSNAFGLGHLILRSAPPGGAAYVGALDDPFVMEPGSRIAAALAEFTIDGSEAPMLRLEMAWNEPSLGALHLASFRSTDALRDLYSDSDRVVDQLPGVQAGQAIALTTDLLGNAVIAYSRCQTGICAIELVGGIGAANGNLTIASGWTAPIADLAVSLVDGSAREVRVLAIQAGGASDDLRYFRCSEEAGCDRQDFGTVSKADHLRFQDRLAISGRGPLRLLWVDEFADSRRNQFHQQNDERGGHAIATLSGPTDALYVCPVSIIPTPLPPGGFSKALQALASDADAGLNARLRARFAQTAAGRYYLDLYLRHGEEIVALTLADPAQALAHASTFQNFVPALTRFVDGDGSQVIFTPELIAQAREVMEYWRDHGSPSLRAAVIDELDRLDDLSVFSGLSFAQWFDALSVGTAGDVVFADDFESEALR